MQVSQKKSRAYTSLAGRTCVHLEVLMQVSQEIEQGPKAGDDPVEDAARRAYCGDKPDLVIDPTICRPQHGRCATYLPAPKTSSIGMARYRSCLAVTAVLPSRVG